MLQKAIYKKLNNLKYFYNVINKNRILKFKRTKWKKLQKKIKQTNFFYKRIKKKYYKYKKSRYKKYPFNKKIYLLNFEKKKIFKKHYIISDSNLIYKKFSIIFLKKEREKMYKGFKIFYGNKLSIKYFKKLLKNNLHKKDLLFFSLLIKPFYILNILLWKLGFYKTLKEVNNACKQKFLIHNSETIKNNSLILKKNDIIHIKKCFKQRFFYPTFLFTFLEINYYTKEIMIIRNYLQFKKDSFRFLFYKYTKIQLFINYIKNN